MRHEVLLRRTGTVPNAGVCDGPGSAAHRKSAALRPGHETVQMNRNNRNDLLAPMGPIQALRCYPVRVRFPRFQRLRPVR